jgi:serine/threonine-protein kinase RsbW
LTASVKGTINWYTNRRPEGEEPVASSSVRAPVTIRLPFAASSVAVARQRLRDWMVDNHSSGEAIEDARVIISELVANAVRHARPLSDGQIIVTWMLGDSCVELAVTDGGSSTAPRNVHAPATATAGRGMAIVETLANDWWSDQGTDRKTVYARIRR